MSGNLARSGTTLLAAAVLSASGLVVAAATPAAAAGTTVLTETNQGWYDFSGYHDPGNANYVAGDSSAYRDFFTFDLSSIAGAISAATLQIPEGGACGYGNGAAHTYTLYDVSTPISDLTSGVAGTAAYDDLGSGTSYGALDSPPFESEVDVPFNPAGVDALNAAAGSSFAVGGDYPPGTADEYVFGYSSSCQATLSLTVGPSSPPPPQRGASFIQVSVSPDPVDASGPVTASATVSPQQAGGTVQFSLDGANVGDPVLLAGASNSASLTLPGPFSAGKHLVGATYSGDANYNSSFNNYQFTVNPAADPTPTPTGDVVNPTITATPLSGHPASSAGWYRSPVMVTYHCTEGSAPLDADGCPQPDGVTTDGSHTFTRTVTATDGGKDSVTTTIKLDRTDPDLTVHGVTPGKTYKHTRSITCTASDATSGLAGPCTITTHRHHHKIHYKATATDNAGNTTKIKGHYTLKH